MDSTKPFSISKQAVWKAYQQVKANHGAAGVDGESIIAFDARLKDNLYKLWNRLASGSSPFGVLPSHFLFANSRAVAT